MFRFGIEIVNFFYCRKCNSVNYLNDRIPDPPRGEVQYPSDIEQLLRDYSRAREEARTEIAKARERLRERTEQEKRRLQQQALSQEVKVGFGVIAVS